MTNNIMNIEEEQPQIPHRALSAQDAPSSPLSSLPSRPPSGGGSASPLASESEGPNTEDNDEGDSPPARKGKKVCPSSAAISTSVRATVIRKAGGKCWLCGLNGVHIAHVIAGSEAVLVPIWAFLPVDLDHFIVQESAFHRARAHAASLGLPLSRPDPCNGTILALRYGRYQIRPNYLHNINFLTQPIKRWYGNPVAAILRSAGIIAGVECLDPVTQGGLPEDVAHKLQELLFLYGVAAPPVMRPAPMVDLVGRCVRHSASGDQPPTAGPRQDRDSTPPPRTLRDTKHHGNTRRATETKDVQHTQTLLTPPHSSLTLCRKRGRNDGEMPTWVFGPMMTSNMLIAWSMDSLEIEAEDDACRQARINRLEK